MPMHACGQDVCSALYCMYSTVSSCLRQVPPPCQPSVLGGDSWNDDGGDGDGDDDDDCDGDDDDDDEEGDEEEEEEEEEGCRM